MKPLEFKTIAVVVFSIFVIVSLLTSAAAPTGGVCPQKATADKRSSLPPMACARYGGGLFKPRDCCRIWLPC